MVVVDGKGVPLGITIASASPAEVTLVDQTLATIRVPRSGRGRPRSRPSRMIGDKAYDSDPLRARLAQRSIELIAASIESDSSTSPGWSETATIQAKMDCGADLCLAGFVSTIGRPLRAVSATLSRILPFRLRLGGPQGVMKPLLDSMTSVQKWG